MGFRFRRSIFLIPGVRFNLGRKSASFSFGVRGLHYTVGTRGSQVTAGVPGSGLSFTHRFSKLPTAIAPVPQQATLASHSNPQPISGIPVGVIAAPTPPKSLSTNARFAIAGTGIAVATFGALGFLSKLFY